MKKLLYNTRGIIIRFSALLAFSINSAKAQIKPSLVDFDAYEQLVAEVKQHRQSHLVNAQQFISMSKEEKVIILDTRSDSMYAAVHVKGAIHLNFSDFTQDNLDKLIPSPDYKILIYCNNNFETALPSVVSIKATVQDFSPYFVTKMAKPMIIDPKIQIQPLKSKKTKSKQKGPNSSMLIVNDSPLAEKKPLTLALNIPTYINLYGYGYKNVYELSELVDVNSGALEFEGTAVKR